MKMLVAVMLGVLLVGCSTNKTYIPRQDGNYTKADESRDKKLAEEMNGQKINETLETVLDFIISPGWIQVPMP